MKKTMSQNIVDEIASNLFHTARYSRFARTRKTYRRNYVVSRKVKPGAFLY